MLAIMLLTRVLWKTPQCGKYFNSHTSPAVSQQTLPGPEAAARMASQASGKQRKDAEARVVKATADALHLLGWLRMALPVLPGNYLALCTRC